MSKPVNILYVIDSLAYGGTERQLDMLIRNLDRDSFMPHLCTLKESSSLFECLEIPKILLNFKSFFHLSMLGNIAMINGFIGKHRIHIVQTFFQDPFLLAALAKQFHRVKLIGSFRDLGFWRNTSESRKMRLSYPFFDGFIANSEAVKGHFVSMDSISADKIEVIYNGFDVSKISADTTADSKFLGNPLVGMVANLNRPVKRAHDFIEAAAIVKRKIPETRFVIVGDGPLRNDLERQAESLGLKHHLFFTGRIANPLDKVRGFHVGVITSESEGFCNAIIEYMACGIPVVATAAGGNPELIKEGENGFMVNVGDVGLMAERIVMLLKDASLRGKISRANNAKISDEFSIRRMVTNHETYYGRIISQ